MIEMGKFDPPGPLNTAVLFLVFNRLDQTKQVFEAIRQAKPPRLYVAADGARAHKQDEVEQVRDVRNFVLQNIDWDCEVKTLFREKNLGCKYAVSSAITWFFDSEEQGIILEDDCLPSQSFFWFCEELLERYKEDLRVWLISGDNFQNGLKRGDDSYYFSQFNHIWGWASWASRWAEYDVEMESFESFSKQNRISSVFSEINEQKYWLSTFDQVYQGKIDTWDYQWNYTVLSNNGLSVLPNINLISNIGFGDDATHTKSLESINSNIPRFELSVPLNHPYFIVQDVDADAFTFARFFKKDNLAFRVAKKFKRLVLDVH
tara:strand:- start:10925 stop:11878 length:954 start_codon:yes stop_codon:yes gene_type:complete